jgi:hypothetical protein
MKALLRQLAAFLPGLGASSKPKSQLFRGLQVADAGTSVFLQLHQVSRAAAWFKARQCSIHRFDDAFERYAVRDQALLYGDIIPGSVPARRLGDIGSRISRS